MMARPSVRALTEWGTLLGTIATIPFRAIWVTPSMVYLELALDYLIYFFLRMEILANERTAGNEEAPRRAQFRLRRQAAGATTAPENLLPSFCRESLTVSPSAVTISRADAAVARFPFLPPEPCVAVPQTPR